MFQPAYDWFYPILVDGRKWWFSLRATPRDAAARFIVLPVASPGHALDLRRPHPLHAKLALPRPELGVDPWCSRNRYPLMAWISTIPSVSAAFTRARPDGSRFRHA